MSLDEFDLIRRHFRPLASAPAALGLADDAAVVAVEAGHELVVTTDTLVAGVHFLADDPPETLGHKLLAVNLSDLAAMGAEPIAYLLSVALPRAWAAEAADAWLTAFARGLGGLQRQAGIALIGGDTVGTPTDLVLGLTALGRVSAGRALRRSGARPGDLVWVSGTIGDGALGLAVLSGQLPGLPPSQAAALVERYRRPSPRLALGRRLIGVATAVADVSDGLIADLGHICEASGAAAELHLDRLPLSEAGRAFSAAAGFGLADLASGGDDYELVFTAPASAADAVVTAAAAAAVPVSEVGRIVAVPPADPVGRKNSPVQVVSGGRAVFVGRGGYSHFRGNGAEKTGED
ncbi:MAG: thiamine-phosphate kinase [Rhodospirillales bacterium]